MKGIELVMFMVMSIAWRIGNKNRWRTGQESSYSLCFVIAMIIHALVCWHPSQPWDSCPRWSIFHWIFTCPKLFSRILILGELSSIWLDHFINNKILVLLPFFGLAQMNKWRRNVLVLFADSWFIFSVLVFQNRWGKTNKLLIFSSNYWLPFPDQK